MTGTTELSAIITQETLTQNIASHLTDPTDIQNFTLTNRAIYHFLTKAENAKSLWGQFTATHNQKIPPSLYVTLAFHPRVHRYEDGLEIWTFGVFELKLTQLNARAVMQTRQIPYIDNPALHLLATGHKLEKQGSWPIGSCPQFTISHTKPTRDILMRKEILNWLYCLYGNFRKPDLRDVNMYSAYIGSSFDFHHFFHEMVGDDFPDFDLSRPRSQGLMPNGQNGRPFLTYTNIIDLLLSGVISFDQFKSLMCPSRKTGTQSISENLDPLIFDLFRQVQDFDKVKNHPLETLLFFKKIYEMIKFDPDQGADFSQQLKAQLNNVLIELLAFPHFSCRTFCAVFVPKELKQQEIELLIQRLSLFLEAVRNGTFTLDALNAALERNPNLEIPLIHMSRAFYEAVHHGFISISSLLNRRTPLSDFYDPSNLITEDVDVHAYGITDQQFIVFARHLNQFYTRFMALAMNHPDHKTDQATFMRDANQFLQLMKSLSIDFMRRLTANSDVENAFSLFLAFREKTQNLYRDTILKHIKHETHQDILLSAELKEFIFPQAAWRAMVPDTEHESYETWLKTLEETHQKALMTHNVITQLRILSTCSAAELEAAAQQIKVLSNHQDPQKLTPAMISLMSLHRNYQGKIIEEFYRSFQTFIPLFRDCDFPVQFSVWDLINTNMHLIHGSAGFFRTLQSTDPETLKEHIMLLKNEALKLGALYFGTEAGYRLCESFFSSPKRVMTALLLLATGQWTKQDYIKVVKTFIAMHYERNCSAYYQYDPMSFSFSSRRRPPTTLKAIDADLPDQTSSHVFDPHIFADEILVTTLENILLNLNKTGKELWNAACLKADEGRVTVTP